MRSISRINEENFGFAVLCFCVFPSLRWSINDADRRFPIAKFLDSASSTDQRFRSVLGEDSSRLSSWITKIVFLGCIREALRTRRKFQRRIERDKEKKKTIERWDRLAQLKYFSADSDRCDKSNGIFDLRTLSRFLREESFFTSDWSSRCSSSVGWSTVGHELTEPWKSEKVQRCSSKAKENEFYRWRSERRENSMRK